MTGLREGGWVAETRAREGREGTIGSATGREGDCGMRDVDMGAAVDVGSDGDDDDDDDGWVSCGIESLLKIEPEFNDDVDTSDVVMLTVSTCKLCVGLKEIDESSRYSAIPAIFLSGEKGGIVVSD